MKGSSSDGPIIQEWQQRTGAGEPGTEHFFMGGNVKEINHAVRLTKDRKKGAFIHLNLIRGLSGTDKENVDFISDYVGADGIITRRRTG